MKIAFCFSGQLRSFATTFPFIKERILDQASDYDVFCSLDCEEDLEIVKVLSPVKVEVCPPLPENDLEQFESGLNKRYLWMGNSIKNSLRNYFAQLWKLKHSFTLLESSLVEGSYYDLVVRMRYDFLPISDVNFDNIKNNYVESVFLPFRDSRVYDNDFFKGKVPLNDMFAVGRLPLMEYYFKQFDFFSEIVKSPSVNISQERSIFLKLLLVVNDTMSIPIFNKNKLVLRLYYGLVKFFFRPLLKKNYVDKALSPGIVLQKVLELNAVDYTEVTFDYIILREDYCSRSIIVLGDNFY